MKNKIVISTLFCVLIFNSCVVKPYVIMTDYKNDKVKGKDLLIITVRNVNIEVEEDINKVFGDGEVESLYVPFFHKNLEKKIQSISTFSDVYTGSLQDAKILSKRELIVPKDDKIQMDLPIDGKSVLDSNGSKADFVLFISKLEVLPTSFRMQYGSAPGIEQVVDYTFWDNTKGKIVCYGIGYGAGGKFLLDESGFKLWTEQVANNMIFNSPFKR
jgi:hypothetical protein